MKEAHVSEDIAESPGNGVSANLDLKNFPYLERLSQLQDSYPALRPLVDRLLNENDTGRKLVSERYAHTGANGGSPGRCAVLTFGDNQVEAAIYTEHESLKKYLDEPSMNNPLAKARRRLFILEDLDPYFVEVLGDSLGVDPLVFSEQMNTWSSTDSKSIPYRSLPSMHSAEQSFTLRYFEIRTLAHEDSVRSDMNQMTHASNRRRIERWRDVDLPGVTSDSRHATVRRCASFWTSNAHRSPEAASTSGVEIPSTKDVEQGWDALILVDPPLASCDTCKRNTWVMPGSKQPDQPFRQHWRDRPWKPYDSCLPSCLILEDPRTYASRKELWKARNWAQPGSVVEARHNSVPYHGGGPCLVPPPLTQKHKHANFDKISKPRNLSSALDEIVFYWTECPDHKAVQQVHRSAVNSAYYLLKFVANHWAHQLELIGYHVANSEWFADEHDSNVNAQSPDWKQELEQISKVSKDINYTIRQMGRFDHAVTLNVERLGALGDVVSTDTALPTALVEAQRDFLALSSRLKPLRQRIDDISGIATDVANLRASLKGIQDGDQGLRLSLFAAVIFPLTLVAAMLSMADPFQPGGDEFWVFWAASVPLAFVIGLLLMYRQVEHFVMRMKEFVAGMRQSSKRSGKTVKSRGEREMRWENV